MLFENEETLEMNRDELINRKKSHVGLVAVNVPLISNLNVCDNIALIIQYHRDMPVQEAESLVLTYLKRYNLEKIAQKRNPALSDRERFCAMLLRSAMVAGAIILIDRPLKLLPDLEDNRFFYNTLSIISDLFNECHILDYKWNRPHYEMIYEAE
jgi:ABC-type lipoprotein export system ATPase subunit